MPATPRVLLVSIAAIRLGRIANVLSGLFLVAAFIGSLIAEPQLAGRLMAKYGSRFDVDATLLFVRGVLMLGAPAVWAVERLLASLRKVLASVAAGDPFAAANVGRFRTIGWMLLVLQLVDLALGIATWLARPLGFDMLDWQPSFTGSIAVLVAFVLVRIFAIGTALRDDLAGTV